MSDWLATIRLDQLSLNITTRREKKGSNRHEITSTLLDLITVTSLISPDALFWWCWWGGGLNSLHLWVNVYTICLSCLNDLIGQYAFSINLIKNIFKCLCLMSANLKLFFKWKSTSAIVFLSVVICLIDYVYLNEFILLAQRSWCHIYMNFEWTYW